MIDGKKLRGMRLDIGWSQNVMSKILEITRGSLAHYESGRAAVPDLE
jgi:predicted transcriptional regulator